MTARFVLVHGLYTSRTMWRPQHVALREAGFPVAIPDLPGHGRRRSEPFTLHGALTAVDEAVSGIRESPLAPPGPVILVGLSLGGYIAMEYAGRHPERIDGLMPMACAARPSVLGGLGPRIYGGLTGALQRLPDRGFQLDAAVQRLVGGRAAAQAFLAGGYGIDAASAAIAAVQALDPIASLGRVAAARLPTWFVNGELDQMRLEQVRFTAAAGRDSGRAWRTIVPGATHMVNLSAAWAVTRVLRLAGEAIG